MAQMDSPYHDTKDLGKGRKPVLPPPGTKWSQDEVHYQPQAEPGGCGKCKHFDPSRSRCEVVAGFIQQDACCDFFNEDQFPPPPVSKFDSGYVRVPGASYLCSDCEFWNAGTCQIVAGKIDPGGVCWEWNNDPANMKVGPQAVAQGVADDLPNDAPLAGSSGPPLPPG